MRTKNIDVYVDAVLFCFDRAQGVKIVLYKRSTEPFKHRWALPGGYVHDDESLEKAVQREVEDIAFLKPNYMEQLYTFGKPDRDPRGRVLSVAYIGFIRPGRVAESKAKTANNAVENAWFEINRLPDIAFDHRRIIQTALGRLRRMLFEDLLCFELLDNKFLLSDLEQLYTVLTDQVLERRNFRKKLLSSGLLEELMEKNTGVPGRPALFYRFDRSKYYEMRDRGVRINLF